MADKIRRRSRASASGALDELHMVSFGDPEGYSARPSVASLLGHVRKVGNPKRRNNPQTQQPSALGWAVPGLTHRLFGLSFCSTNLNPCYLSSSPDF
jgi:hypothetical protein